MRAKPIEQRATEALAAIDEHWQLECCPPTIAWLKSRVKCGSAAIQKTLAYLEWLGEIEYRPESGADRKPVPKWVVYSLSGAGRQSAAPLSDAERPKCNIAGGNR